MSHRVAERAAVHAGRQRALRELAIHPSQPDWIVARYRQGGDGLVVSEDGGQTWGLLCTAGMGGPFPDLGPIALAADRTLFMGRFDGLFASAEDSPDKPSPS